jgi:hypothetical protein
MTTPIQGSLTTKRHEIYNPVDGVVITEVVLWSFVYGVSKRALQLYFECYCVASVAKTFTRKGVQILE